MADEEPQRGVKQRNKIVMSQEEIDEFLSGRRSMTMSTINSDGSIHSIAMWYGFLEGCIGIESKAKAQKVMNLRRNPNLTVLVEDGETYETLRGVTLIGKAEIIDDPDRMFELGISVFDRYMAPYTEEMKGASAIPIVTDAISMFAKGISLETPSAPCNCIVRRTASRYTFGVATFTAAISFRAAWPPF